MSSILEVTADQIAQIGSPEQLVDLLRRLLHAEARANGIARRGVSVPSQITVSDAGEDARIEWSGGPENTNYLPARICLFQAKATDMPQQKCASEVLDKKGVLKQAIRQVLENDGAYIVFSTDTHDRSTHLTKRIKGIRTGIQDGSENGFPNAVVDFYGANKIRDWVNSHPSVAIWALEQLFGRRVSGIQSWEGWNRNPDVQTDKYDYVFGQSADEKLDLKGAVKEIRAHLAKPRAVARIVGLSGLGKTRLALEAFRPLAADATSTAESVSVIYAKVFSQADAPIALLHNLQSEKLDGIVVVDDCELSLHHHLSHIARHPDSNFSLLTLDYDPGGVDPQSTFLEMGPLDDDTIKGIIRQAYATLSEEDVERIASLAQGFPAMAVLLGNAELPFEGKVLTLTSDDVLKRMIWGRQPPDPDGQNVLAACSLFDTLGIEGPAKSELEFVAKEISGLTWEEFFSWVKRFQRRPLIQQRGNYVQVLPKPLALRLAGDRWEEVHPQTAEKWFNGDMPERLRTSLCDQLALLDFNPSAQTVVEKLCGPSGPFGNPEVLNTETGSRCFRSLVEVNPQATLHALVAAFGSWTTDQLRSVKDGRRNLVWALEKLCFRRETFQEAARLLLAFGAAENESWSNNARGQFMHLYQLYLSGSEATGEEKLAIIDEALSSGDPNRIELAVDALTHGLTTWSFMRTMGAERQGTGQPLKDWRPNPLEARQYLEAILTRLTNTALSDPTAGPKARNAIPGNIRGLLSMGLIDKLETSIRTISESYGLFWPEAMAGINDALHFDKLPPDVIERAKRLRADLGPRSVSERLKFYVSETPWGFFRRDDAKESSDLPVRRLADELSHECELIVEHLPDLLNGTQRNIYPFGEQLGKVIEDPQRLLNSAFEVLKISDPKDANPAFVGAVLAGLEKRDSRLVESTLDQIASEPSLFRYLVDVTIFINIQTRDLKRITTALEAGHLDISTIRKLAYGQALHAVGPDAVKELLTTLLRLEREATWVGLEIATFYLHILPSAYSLLRESIISMLSTPRLLAAGGEAQLDEYHFKELAERVLNDGDEEFARHLATEIVAIARLRSYPYSLDHVLQPLVLILLSPRYQAAVWPVFETAISEAKGIELFHFEHMLGKGLDHFGDGIGPIFIMGDEQLLAWCRKKPEKAPAFLARVAPLLKTDADKRTWTPLIEALLDEFGDQDAVLSAISANLGTFGWSGSLVPYYEQFIEPLSSLTNHPRKKVREFARRQLSSFQQAIFEETARDQERDFGIYH